ncbi:MAG: hypothetical protein GXW85_03210 [Clostridia bacterium]|nr:hypothetical protein [Clostridia bacterium]
MVWKNRIIVAVYLLLLLALVIVGTNISARKLAMAVDKEITPPFIVTPLDNGNYRLDILGDSYQFSTLSIQNSLSLLESSIQNSWVTVKFNLASRVGYLRYHLSNGVEQLTRDITKILP